MLISAIRRDVAFEVFALGLITALSLACTDIIFVIERSIPAVYLLDAVAESLFVTLWVFAIRVHAGRPPTPGRPPPSPPSSANTPNQGGQMAKDEPVKTDYVALGFEKIDRDLQFLIGCLGEVLTSLGLEDLAALLPWTGQGIARRHRDACPPRPASSSRLPSSS